MYKTTGKFRLFTIILILLSAGNAYAQNPILLPAPAEAEWGNGRFSLKGAEIAVSPDLMTREQTTLLGFTEYVRKTTGILLPLIYSGKDHRRIIYLESERCGQPLPLPGDKAGPGSGESYKISVTGNGINIRARSDAGLFYAVQTLKQMIVSDSSGSYIPEAEIEDYPELAFRGVMVDFSHGGLLTEEEIRNQIDFLARWKVNQYYFYNEVSIEMKGYPLLNYNACYSREQIKRIIAYGKERHIDVIPFVNFYGHLHELLRIEKYSDFGIGRYGHDLDPREPGVRALLKEWIRQYADLFPSPFIHIGFDETWETERLKSDDPSIRPEELYLSQLEFVTGELGSYGKTIMVWTDISATYPDIISRFPDDLIPVIWEYSDKPASVTRWLDPVRREGFPFFMQSAVDSWGNIYPAAGYTFDNIDICLKTCQEENGTGYITSVWTDAVQPLLRNTWLFMAYGSSGAWRKGISGRTNFTSAYCDILYPAVSKSMNKAFVKMAESEDLLAKCLGRHTINEMWEDPFSSFHISNTASHIDDYRNARIAAEEALESLTEALNDQHTDSAFAGTLMVNCRLLEYTATRFIWAVTIVDRWNRIISSKSGKKADNTVFYDINYSAHGLITDMMDYCTAIREEYRKAWLSENMEYRLGTITGRFDSEYLLWRNLGSRISNYENHNNGRKRQKFEDIFLQD